MIAQWMLSTLAVGAMTALIGSSVVRLVPRDVLGRRWIWLGTMVVSIALPVAMAARPRADVPPPPPPSVTPDVSKEVAAVSSSAPFDLDAWLLLVWSALSVALGAGFIATHRRTIAQMASWRSGDVGGEQVIISPDFGPAAVGLQRARVVIPEWVLALSAEEQALILLHERQHIAARDHWLLLGAVSLGVLMPWSPALWWQLRRLRVAIELDCDARVAPTPTERPRYSRLLLHVRRRQHGYRAALAFFPTSSALAERVFALLDPSRPSRARRAAWLGAAIVAAGGISRIPVPGMLSAAAPVTSTSRARVLDVDSIGRSGSHVADTARGFASARPTAPSDTIGARRDRTVTPRDATADSVAAFIAAGGYARLIPIDSLPAVTAGAAPDDLSAARGGAVRGVPITTSARLSPSAGIDSITRLYKPAPDTITRPMTARAVPLRPVVPAVRPDSG